MTPERFQTIVEAYGANARRWPEAERDSALEWASQHREQADVMLASSGELDDWLDADIVKPASTALFDRIVDSAPAARPWQFWRRPRMRWPGIAVAGVGVGVAGGLAGALIVSFVLLTAATTTPVHDAAYLATGFTGPTSDGSDE